MPRLSLYRPEKGNDYDFLDQIISEQFQVGGTDVLLHKYLGPDSPEADEGTADQPTYESPDPTQIQDLLFLENRDRKYDPDIYSIRGIYNVQDIDFNLSQFGLFLDNNTIFLTVHINSSVKTVGRKIISGDVIELPHLKDPYNLSDVSYALKRFYVVDDVSRASEGFSPTWYPHLYRLKLKQIVDSQEYRDILDLPADEDTPGGDTLRDMLSTFEREMQINDAVIEQAEADAPKSGYDTSNYYTVSVESDETGSTPIVTQVDGDYTTAPPPKRGYSGYLLGDGDTPNGNNFGHGIQFPDNPEKNDYFLRTDFLPKRMFQYDGNKWVKVQDNVRMTMTNSQDRRTQKTSFVNNDRFTYNDLVAQDIVRAQEGDTEIHTEIPAGTEALYLVLKYETVEKDYVIADHPGIFDTLDSSQITIRLPVINGIQETVDFDGVWEVKLYNNREAERQSISQALKPRSDN
jgi:hypothetical protein